MEHTLLALALVVVGVSPATAQDMPIPFGSEADAGYARLLWDV